MSSFIHSLLFPPLYRPASKSPRSLVGRRAVITGASSGIGLALARELAAAGAHLVLIARREEVMESVRHDCIDPRQQLLIYPTDLRDRDSVETLCRTLAQLPRVDYLFCNAGKSIRRPIRRSLDRMHDYDRTMEVNYRSAVRLTLALLPALERAAGRVVFSSAVSLLYPFAPHWSAYHTSKQALSVWAQTARCEYKHSGVSFGLAYLPLVRTPMIAPTPAYQKMPALTPYEAASRLWYLAQSRKAAFIPWWARLTFPPAQVFTPLIRLFYAARAHH